MKMKKPGYAIVAVAVIAVATFISFQPAPIAAPESSNPAEPQNVITCQDSDGTDMSTKGTAVQTANGAESIYIDECAGGILKEFTCNGNRIASRLEKCNCQDGRCI